MRDPLADRPAPAHHDAADTELAAAELVRPRAGRGRRIALDALALVYPRGLTDPELAERTGKYLYTIAPRRKELCDDGWVEDSGERRPTDHGRTAIVWRLTERGAAALTTTTRKDTA